MPAQESNSTELTVRQQPLIDLDQVALEWRRIRKQFRLWQKWWLRPHRAYQPLFVIATWRSGSNLLLSYLNQQPGVACLGEVLCAKLAIGPRRHCVPVAKAIKHIRYSLQGERAPVRGCKLMLHQLASCSLDMDRLHATFPNAKYVILYRQCLCEQYVSQQLATATRQFVLRPGEERRRAALRIDPAELRAYCDDVRRRYRDTLAHPWLAGRAVLLSYEELVADPNHWLREQICPLLGVPYSAPQAQLRKQNDQPLAEQIENYREVSSLLTSPLCRQQHQWPGGRVGRAA